MFPGHAASYSSTVSHCYPVTNALCTSTPSLPRPTTALPRRLAPPTRRRLNNTRSRGHGVRVRAPQAAVPARRRRTVLKHGHKHPAGRVRLHLFGVLGPTPEPAAGRATTGHGVAVNVPPNVQRKLLPVLVQIPDADAGHFRGRGWRSGRVRPRLSQHSLNDTKAAGQFVPRRHPLLLLHPSGRSGVGTTAAAAVATASRCACFGP